MIVEILCVVCIFSVIFNVITLLFYFAAAPKRDITLSRETTPMRRYLSDNKFYQYRSLLIDYDDTLKLVSKHASLMDNKFMTLCFRSRPPSVMREIEKPKEERPDFNFGLRPRLIQAGQEFKLICCVQCTPTPKVGKDRGDICVVNTMVLSIFLC